MTTQNQDGVRAIQLDGVSETLVASTEMLENSGSLLGFEPTRSDSAKADAFLGGFPTTTAALIALLGAIAKLEDEATGEGERFTVTTALRNALPAIAAVEAVSL